MTFSDRIINTGIEDKFEQLSNDLAMGIDRQDDLKKLLAQFDDELSSMPRDIRDEYLRKLSSKVNRFDDTNNPVFNNFIFEFSMWVYNWKTKTVKKVQK